MIESILVITVILLYSKWIFIGLVYPLQSLWGLYQNNKSSMICKVLAIPYFCVEKVLRNGGVDSFCSTSR